VRLEGVGMFCWKRKKRAKIEGKEEVFKGGVRRILRFTGGKKFIFAEGRKIDGERTVGRGVWRVVVRRDGTQDLETGKRQRLGISLNWCFWGPLHHRMRGDYCGTAKGRGAQTWETSTNPRARQTGIKESS